MQPGAAALGWLMPVGTLIAYAGATRPAGFLACEGAVVLRSLYPDLFSMIGTSHGDGSHTYNGIPTGFAGTHFNLPDYRGRFLRGVDAGLGRDPDATSRTELATGGNAGDRVGSVQLDDFKSHRHGIRVVNTDPGGPPVSIDSTPATTPASTLPLEIDASGGLETRPYNVYVKYLIKCGRNDGC